MIYACPYENCAIKFERPHKLHNHLNLHVGVRTFLCPKENCGKSYSTSSHLKRHIKTVHEAHKRLKIVYVCTAVDCTSVFKTAWGLRKHERSRHEESSSSVSCPETVKNTEKRKYSDREYELYKSCLDQNSNLAYRSSSSDQCSGNQNTDLENSAQKKVSKKTVNSKKGNKYSERLKSSTDQNSEKQKSNLKSRTKARISTQTEEKITDTECYPEIFICAQCEKTFKTRSNLVDHIGHIHDSECPVYVCGEGDCSYTFRYKRNLAAHIRCDHFKILFPCTFPDCTRKFHYKKSMLLHLRRCHPK